MQRLSSIIIQSISKILFFRVFLLIRKRTVSLVRTIAVNYCSFMFSSPKDWRLQSLHTMISWRLFREYFFSPLSFAISWVSLLVNFFYLNTLTFFLSYTKINNHKAYVIYLNNSLFNNIDVVRFISLLVNHLIQLTFYFLKTIN